MLGGKSYAFISLRKYRWGGVESLKVNITLAGGGTTAGYTAFYEYFPNIPGYKAVAFTVTQNATNGPLVSAPNNVVINLNQRYTISNQYAVGINGSYLDGYGEVKTIVEYELD